MKFYALVPIHTIPVDLDHTLGMTRPCPRYDQVFTEYVQSAEIQSMQKGNETLFKYVEKNSGEKVRDFSDIVNVFEPIFIERSRNLT